MSETPDKKTPPSKTDLPPQEEKDKEKLPQTTEGSTEGKKTTEGQKEWVESPKEKAKKTAQKSRESVDHARENLSKARDEDASVKQGNAPAEDALRGLELPGNLPLQERTVQRSDVEKTEKQVVEKQDEYLRALKEKQKAQIQELFFDLPQEVIADPESKKFLHNEALQTLVDVDKLPAEVKQEVLKTGTTPDGKPLDVSKLTPKQKEIIRRFQVNKYLEAVKAAQESKKTKENNPHASLTPEEIQELAKTNLGLQDFGEQQKSLLSDEKFLDEIKKNPELLSSTVESVAEDGMISNGLDPQSGLGKALTRISQSNFDDYRKMFPEEKDFKKIGDIFPGLHTNVIGNLPLQGLENFTDSIADIRTQIQNWSYKEWLLREDFPSEDAYQKALDAQARLATGMSATKIDHIAQKLTKLGNLSPFMEFLANIFAGIWAALEESGLIRGTFWRDFLNRNKDADPNDRSLWSGWWGSFEQLAETNAGALINAARGYLGRPYKMGGLGRKDVPNDPIDCSQLVVNSLVDTGCIPAGSDTTAMGFASMSQKIGDTEGKEGDFLIMGEPSPHIAIITAHLWGGKYKTIESASGKWGVVETERQAGSSFSVYRNPFLEGNGGIRRGRMGSDIAGMKDIMRSHGAKPEYIGGVEWAANEIKRNQARYERVARMTWVPWELIGAIHFRESSFSFEKALHNGDKIIGTGQKTYRVPAGRGPFATWEESAIDALRMKGGLGFTSINGSDDQLRRVAAYAERYNGYGYRNRGGVSPYVWSGTDKYKGGMYVADHVYNPNKKDPRPGVMPIIMSVLKKSWVTEPPLAQNETTTTVNNDAISESNELSPDAEKYGKIASTFDSFVQRRVGYTFWSRDISKGLDCMTSVEEAIRGAYPEEFMKLIGDARVESINLWRQPGSRQDLTTNDNKNDKDTWDQVVDELGTRWSQTLYVRGVDMRQQISNWLKRWEGAYMSRWGSHVMFVYKEPSGTIVVYRCDGTQNGKNNPGCVKATLENEIGKGSPYYRLAKLDFSKIAPPKVTPEKESPQKAPPTQESPQKVEEVFKSVWLTEQMMDAFIQKIEKSEYDGDQRNIVQWNPGETFPSLGIGHFIWLQAGSKEKFQESFPEMIQYLQSHWATLPASCANLDIRNGSCPWNTVEDMKKFPGLQDLKDFLGTPANKRLQFMFIFEKRLVPFLDSSSWQKLKQLISSDPARVPYAVIDYINFKGEWLNPDKDVEIVWGQKVQWWLKQVLDGMKEPFNLASFKDSAKRVLQSRDPKKVDESKKGWLARIDAY